MSNDYSSQIDGQMDEYPELTQVDLDRAIYRIGLKPPYSEQGVSSPGIEQRESGQKSMSSFSNPHFMYLFDLRNGKKKLAYGQSPEDALEILRIRLSEDEMAQILPEKYEKINQRKLQEYVHLLG